MMKNWIKSGSFVATLGILLMSVPTGLRAQQTGSATSANPNDAKAAANFTPTMSSTGASDENQQVVKLSPFEVKATPDNSYQAVTTLAGNRLSTKLSDIGNAVQVVTNQELVDLAATDNQTLLQYTTNTEVGGIYGNFAGAGDSSHLDESFRFVNPNTDTRVRGLTSADNTRDYFLTDIPWDSYNVDGVDLQRGPNSILFGQGSPAGIINSRLKQASFRNSNQVTFTVDNWGSTRETVDFNKVLLPNELAIRIDGIYGDQRFEQKPAHSTQRRVYTAIRYEPHFLNFANAHTIIKANIEFGRINSNTPRQLPPVDTITPWFYTGTTPGYNIVGDAFAFPNMNRMTVSPQQNEDDNTGLPNHGQNRPSHNGPTGLYPGNPPVFPASIQYSGLPNEYFQPWIAGSMLGVYNDPAFNFQYNNASQGTAIDWEPSGNHSPYLPASQSVQIYQRPGSIATYSTMAQAARLEYNNLPTWQFGVYKDKSLTDPSVFNFYKQLLDGPTKWEWNDFRAYNFDVAQTFWDDQIGIEGIYNREWTKQGAVRLLQNDQINIDFNRIYSNGTPDGLNGIPFENGTPNPNLGKAYVGGSGTGAFQNVNNREDGRVTAFIDYDFNKHHTNWATRLLGRQVVTGMWSSQREETDSRNFDLYSINDPAYEAYLNSSATDSPKLAWNSNGMLPFTFIYLGNSLANRTSASGANLPSPQVNPTLVSGQVNNFSAVWKPSTNPSDPSYVDPTAFWYNNYYPMQNPIPQAPDGLYRDGNGAVTTSPGNSTQASNPANYVGFTNMPINILNSLTSPAAQDMNTTGAKLTKSVVKSKAVDWQAHLWDNAIVGTFGVREDTAKSWQYSLTTSSPTSLSSNYDRLDLSSSSYHLNVNPDNTIFVRSKAWTVMAHINQMPGFSWLPIQVSFFYNHSTDFQPAAQRVDVYGVPLAAPEGETKDQGILLQTKDGKYSLKINKYTTTSTNASSSSLNGAYFIGASQAWAANWVNRFQYNWTGDTQANAVAVNDPNNSEYNYAPASGETLAQAQAREASVVAAWRAWQASVDPRFYTAWGINLNDHSKSVSATTPNGFTVPESSVSKGYEVEFYANPTKNWRITVNASKSTAVRTDIGGANLTSFIAAYEKALNTPGKGYSGVEGGVGDLRIWWGGAGNETTLQEWNGNVGGNYHQRVLQEGTDVPELRKYHVNAITTYDFDHGFLKGVSVGGGVRYQSGVVIGYKPIAGSIPGTIAFDLNSPYRGPSETDFDLWVSYTRKIWKNVTWSCQLNIRNLGVGNELVPITTEPDGTPATYRIRPPQTFLLTNRFMF